MLDLLAELACLLRLLGKQAGMLVWLAWRGLASLVLGLFLGAFSLAWLAWFPCLLAWLAWFAWLACVIGSRAWKTCLAQLFGLLADRA